MGISSERVGAVKRSKKKKGVLEEESLGAKALRSYIELFERYRLDELRIEENGFEFVLKRDSNAGGLEVAEEVGGVVGGGAGGGLAFEEAGVVNSVEDGVEDRRDTELVLQGEGEMGVGEMGVGEGEEGQEYTIVSSPIVGTFYSKPSPESPPFVVEGSVVSEDRTIGIVEAMKMMNEIKAECRGKIVKILVEDGSLLKKGQAIFYINPNI